MTFTIRTDDGFSVAMRVREAERLSGIRAEVSDTLLDVEGKREIIVKISRKDNSAERYERFIEFWRTSKADKTGA